MFSKEILNSQSRWIRQEYKTNKDKFEKPFKISVENHASESLTTQLILEQNYQGLGCTVWDGSIALAKMFENDLELMKKLKRFNVLEMGAGCGLVGLTLLHLGAKFVLYEDEDSRLLAQSAVKLLAEGGIMLLCMGRNRNGETTFVNVMSENGYSTAEVPKEKLHPKYQDEVIKIIRVAKQSSQNLVVTQH